MWTYVQISGELVAPGGEIVATGYSGFGAGKNNPTDENVQNVGPIPEGFYDAQTPADSPTHGPFAIFLLPDADNQMFGRSEFYMHGDSIEHPGAASLGCIIQPLAAREAFWNSGDHRLQVVKQISA
jgi:hypothetical protein